MKKAVKMIKGQNLRYIGRPFPGYSAASPYMTFVNDHSVYEITVLYNNTEMVISRYHVKTVG